MDGGSPVFDMSVSTLTRINYGLWESNLAKKDDNANEWFKSLGIIFDELVAWLNEEEMLKHEKLESDSGQELALYNRIMTGSKGKAAPTKVFIILTKWRREIQKDLKKYKLLMREGEDSGSSMA